MDRRNKSTKNRAYGVYMLVGGNFAEPQNRQKFLKT
jgi:hypothetical protein